MDHVTTHTRRGRWIIAVALLASLALGIPTAETHPFVQEAAVDRGPTQSSFVTHTSPAEGSWEFQVLTVSGKPAWGLVQIVQGDPWRTVQMVNFKRPQVGDTLAVTLPAGSYSVRVWAQGGPPGSGLSIATSHPGI